MKVLNKTMAKKLVGGTISMNGETTSTFKVEAYNPKANMFDLFNTSTKTNHQLHLEGLNRMIKMDNKMKHSNPYITIEGAK